MVWWMIGGAIAALTLWQLASGSGAVADPTAGPAQLSHGAVVIDSALLVFREGLESILVLAAVTASFAGANRPYRQAGRGRRRHRRCWPASPRGSSRSG